MHVPAERGARTHSRTPHRHDHTAFFAGSLHGVAGTAHVLGVLPALALPGAAASGAYLVGFAFGTVLAILSGELREDLEKKGAEFDKAAVMNGLAEYYKTG